MKEVYNGYNPLLIKRSRKLRKEMTPEERHLWYDFLKDHPAHFYKQRSIASYYIADFYCSAAKLVIELDGSQHFSEEGLAYDAIRTELIEQYQVMVLRFTNEEIKNNFRGVCHTIDLWVHARSSDAKPAEGQG